MVDSTIELQLRTSTPGHLRAARTARVRSDIWTRTLVYYPQDVIDRPFFNETILQTDPCHSGIAASACTDADSLARKKPKPFAGFDVLTIDQSINRSIDQSACLFDCPVFEVRIFSDGRVCHSGATLKHTGGTHEFRINRRGLTQIAQVLRDAHFDEMHDSYQDGADGCEDAVTDMSPLVLSLS